MFVIVLLFSFLIPINATDAFVGGSSDAIIVKIKKYLHRSQLIEDEEFIDPFATESSIMPSGKFFTGGRINLATFISGCKEFLKSCKGRQTTIYGNHRWPRYLLKYPVHAQDLVTVSLDISPGYEEKVNTFTVHDPDHLLIKNGRFAPELCEPGSVSCVDSIAMYRAAGGTRVVGIYSCQDTKICLKQCPEVPMVEAAVYQMYRLLFNIADGDVPIPASEIILINGQVFSVSEFIKGEYFSRVLASIEHDPMQAHQYTFNLVRFQRLAILFLLTVPEDGGVRNCLIRKITGSNEWEFVFFDNERSLGMPVTEMCEQAEIGNISTRCHCVLFCFHEMLALPIAESVFKEITTDRKYFEKSPSFRSPDRLLRELAEKIQDTDQGKTTLDIPSSHDAIRGMAARLEKFIELVSENKCKSLASIFAGVSPELAAIYKFNEPTSIPADTPELVAVLERIRSIDVGRYSSPTPTSANVPLQYYFGFVERSDSVGKVEDVLSSLERCLPIENIWGLKPLKRSLSMEYYFKKLIERSTKKLRKFRPSYQKLWKFKPSYTKLTIEITEPVYRSLSFQELIVMNRLRDFLSFTDSMKGKSNALSVTAINEERTDSGQFITPPFQTVHQDIWLHRDRNYTVRIKKDNSKLATAILDKRPYDNTRHGLVRLSRTEFTQDNLGYLILAQMNEIRQYSEESGLNIHPFLGYATCYTSLWQDLLQTVALCGALH